MMEKELKIKFHNIMVDLYEKYLFKGRTEYGLYELNLYSRDRDKIIEWAEKSGVFEDVQKLGLSNICFKIDPEALEEWIHKN